MVNGKWAVALIGAGRAGMIHARNFKSAVPHACIVAVADPSKEACLAACEELEIDRWESDYRELLKDDSIDAVVVVTPTKLHREIVINAANAGKHILCEKPMAMTVEECVEMEEAVRKNGVKLQLAFMRRFDASFRAAKEAVTAGAIGDVVMVRSNTRGPSTPKPWMYDISKSNGPLAEVNSHDIDTLRWFTESEFETVFAIAGNYRCPDAKQDFPDFYDNVVLNARFENGMQGLIDGAQGVQYGYDARVEILGTNGCIYLGSTQENSVTVCGKEKRMLSDYINSWKDLFRDAYLEEDKAFIRCLQEDSQPQITGHDGKQAVLVVNAGNLSIKENRIVHIKGDQLC